MSIPTREAVLDALLTKLQTTTVNNLPAFKTTGRRLKDWADVPSTQQPALFLVKIHERRVQQPPQGLPSKLFLFAKAIIYNNTGDPKAIPLTALDNILDGIDVALKPDDLNRNVLTLGGLVHWCWIEGDILTVPGDFDGQGMAVVPISILLP